MILGILTVLLLAIVLWLLLAPMQLEVDSQQQHVKFRWWGLGFARLYLEEASPQFQARIGPWKRTWDPLKWMAARKRDRKNHKPEKKKTRPGSRSLKRIFKVLDSCSIKVFRWDLDTGDYVYNAYLFPVFTAFNRNGKSLSVNFSGRNYFHLIIQNRGIRIIRALL